jgi:hypothetical protein
MIANGKIRITVTNKCDGEFFCESDELLCQQRVVIADAVVNSIEGSGMSMLELRIVVPSQSADTLLTGMIKGDTEIAIGQISRMVDPD